MLVFHVIYHCGTHEKAEALYKEIRELKVDSITRGEDGNLQYEYFYPVDRGGDLVLLEKWESSEKQKAHAAAPHIAALQPVKAKYCESVDMEIYTDAE